MKTILALLVLLLAALPANAQSPTVFEQFNTSNWSNWLNQTSNLSNDNLWGLFVVNQPGNSNQRSLTTIQQNFTPIAGVNSGPPLSSDTGTGYEYGTISACGNTKPCPDALQLESIAGQPRLGGSGSGYGYGYYEARMLIPCVGGSSGAFYVITTGDLGYTELDVIESSMLSSADYSSYHITTHSNNNGSNLNPPNGFVTLHYNTGANLCAAFHRYGLLWTKSGTNGTAQYTFDGIIIPAATTTFKYLLVPGPDTGITCGAYGSGTYCGQMSMQNQIILAFNGGGPYQGVAATTVWDYIKYCANITYVPAAGNTCATGALTSYNPASLNFGSINVGATSNPQTVVLTNTGTAALAITSIVSTDPSEYALPTSSSPCPISPSTLAVNATCNIDATFSPSSTGTKNAAITVTSNSSTSPDSIAVTGVGTSTCCGVISPSCSSIDLGTVQLLGPSPASSVPCVLTNIGNGTVTISSDPVLISGSKYSLTTTCGASLAPNATCSITVTLPTSIQGNFTDTVTMTDNAAGGNPRQFQVTGTVSDISSGRVNPSSYR